MSSTYKKNILIYLTILISILILSLLWNNIQLPFQNISYTESFLINAKFNPETDTLRYIIFISIPLFLYLFLNILFNRDELNLSLKQENKFYDANFFNSYVVIVFILFFFFIVLDYLSLPHKFHIPSPQFDTLHDGEYLTPTYNFFITKNLWSSSLTAHGGADFIYSILIWKFTGLKTIGAAKLYFPILIILLKFFSVILAYQITKVSLLNKNSKLILFTILSFFLVSLSYHNAPINYAAISYRDIYKVLFLIFFIEIFITNKNLTLLHTIITFITFLSLIFHFDIGIYLYLMLFLYSIYLVIIKKYKQFIYIYSLIFLFWFLFLLIFGKNELQSFFVNFFTIFTSMDLIHGYEYPTPFFSIGEDKDGMRATRGLLFQIIAGILVFQSILYKKSLYPKNYKILLLFLFILSLISYKNALGRSEAYHIRMSTDMQLIIIGFFLSSKIIKFIEDKWMLKKNYETFCKLIPILLLILVIIQMVASSRKFGMIQQANIQSILKSKKELIAYVNSNDEKFINSGFGKPKDIKKFLSKFKYINKNESCVQNFTNDLALPYLLKKPTCTKYYASWLASKKENQIDYVDKLNLINPRFIIYKSPGFIVDKIPTYKRLKLVNSYISNNYHAYESFNDYVILEKND